MRETAATAPSKESIVFPLEPTASPVVDSNQSTYTVISASTACPLKKNGKKKMLPPLSAPPSPPASSSSASPSALPASNQEAMTQKPRIEQLLINHVRFAYAFKQNDAAKIMPFLGKDVSLTTMDGSRLEGLSAVLAYLVGPRMTKLSSHMHIKGSPARSGLWQSKFVYEHGLLFKQALYTEVIEWTPDHTIASIMHVPCGSESKTQKASSSSVHHEVTKSLSSSSAASVDQLSTRMSFEGSSPQDEEEPEHQHLTDDPALDASSSPSPTTRKSKYGEKITSRLSRASSSDSSSHLSTSSSSGEVSGSQDMTLKIQQVSCADLAPIRSRKRVNPFLTIRKCPNGGSQWKSSVARHEKNPVWSHIPVELHSLHGDDILEVSLWDFQIFKSVKVATAALVLADLFAREEDEFTTSIQLERMELTDTQPPIQLTMKLSHKNTLRWGQPAVHERGSRVGALDAKTLSEHASSSSDELMIAENSTSGLLEKLQWFVQDTLFADSYSRGTSMLLRAVFGLVLVWLISQLDFDKVKQS